MIKFFKSQNYVWLCYLSVVVRLDVLENDSREQKTLQILMSTFCRIQGTLKV